MRKEQGNKKSSYDIHPVVFPGAAGIILVFVLLTIILHVTGATVEIEGESKLLLDYLFSTVQAAIAENGGWVFVTTVNVVLVVVGWLAISRFGKIRLGDHDEKPEFSTLSWLAMLFSAGMGIGLLFWSVAEPISHFDSPPLPVAQDAAKAQLAMATTFFHWGFHAWGVYALVGLALAFFSFRQGLPLTIRSAFHPLIGNRIHGPLGDTVDILAVVATMFGVATSLGLGVQQVYAGLDHLFGISGDGGQESSGAVSVQIVLIAGITSLATLSVVLGLKKGVRRLSQITMILAALLLLAVVILGPTLFLADSLVQNVGLYMQNFIKLSTWTEAYRGTEWQHGWTIYYWAWWIAWSPFVGMFIARISRGRTIREFLVGALIVPVAVTFVWLTVFGGTALERELAGDHAVSTAVSEAVPTALFVLLHEFPMASLLSVIAMVVVILFFVTSSDSGSLVIDIITAGGNPDPPVPQRVFWAVTEGVVAICLLLAGGLSALQTASITAGFPFAFVLLLLAWSLYKGLDSEYRKQRDTETRSDS